MLAPWTKWTTLFPAPLVYLPILTFVFLSGYMIWFKNKSILISAILLLVFITSAGAAVTAYLGVGGLIILGVVVFALIVAYLKLFY